MSEARGPESEGPPRTGDPDIDAALDQAMQVEDLPVAGHHEVLARAHDQLQQALHRDPSGAVDDGP